MSDVFIVTALKLNHLTKKIRHKKPLGWFNSIEDAKQYVQENVDSIFEGGKFEHTIIESIEHDMFITDKIWMEALFSYFDWELYDLRQCDKPTSFKDVYGFATL